MITVSWKAADLEAGTYPAWEVKCTRCKEVEEFAGTETMEDALGNHVDCRVEYMAHVDDEEDQS